MISVIGHSLFGQRIAGPRAAYSDTRRRLAPSAQRREKRVAREEEILGEKSEPRDESEENVCAARAKNGDRAAFGALVDLYSARIYTHLYRLVGNREEAEDLTQESFLRAYRFLARYDTTKPFRNWLYTIATHVGLNALRARRRRGWPVSLDAERAETPSTHAADPRQHAARRERSLRVAQAVERLPARAASLIHLHYHEGLSIREAAHIVGMSEGAAKVALHRARKTLRTWLIESEES